MLPLSVFNLFNQIIYRQAVFFGANDAVLPGSSSGQHVPLDQYCQNLQEILQHPVVLAHQPHLILITPPPVNEYQRDVVYVTKGYVDADRRAETTQRYASRCREVGERLGVPVLDLWSLMMTKAGWKQGQTLAGSKDAPRNEELEKMLSDGERSNMSLCPVRDTNVETGLHFLPPAYKILFESVLQLIKRIWPDQDPEYLPFCFPRWTDAPKNIS